jgi:hypothetical protein
MTPKEHALAQLKQAGAAFELVEHAAGEEAQVWHRGGPQRPRVAGAAAGPGRCAAPLRAAAPRRRRTLLRSSSSHRQCHPQCRRAPTPPRPPPGGGGQRGGRARHAQRLPAGEGPRPRPRRGWGTRACRSRGRLPGPGRAAARGHAAAVLLACTPCPASFRAGPVPSPRAPPRPHSNNQPPPLRHRLLSGQEEAHLRHHLAG